MCGAKTVCPDKPSGCKKIINMAAVLITGGRYLT